MKTRLLIEKFLMATSGSRRVDGIWVGVVGGRSGDPLLDRIEAALRLIKKYDSMRYLRILRDVERIWLYPLIGAQGQFDFVLKRCSLDLKYVESASPEEIASTIVHEATHGHGWLRKLGYPEPMRYRIEKICFRQQLLFLQKLPVREELSAGVERNLSRPESFWSNKDFEARRKSDAFRAAKSYGMPLWLVRLVLKWNEFRNGVLRAKSFGRKK